MADSRPPREPEGAARRSRTAALLLFGGLLLVLVARFAGGLGDVPFYGLAGGLLASLLIVGLDALHRWRARPDGEGDDGP